MNQGTRKSSLSPFSYPGTGMLTNPITGTTTTDQAGNWRRRCFQCLRL
jgi:hypothetical protein